MIGPQTSSDQQSANFQVITYRSYLHGFELISPATGTSTLTIYDSSNSSTSGKKILTQASALAGQNSLYVEFPTPRVANQGIYATITGTTTYVVGWSPG